MPITTYPGWWDKLRGSDAVIDVADAYSKVPMLYRAVNLRCDALATVPYEVYRNNTQVEWPWEQELPSLIQQTERHLLLFGCAFWLRIRQGNILKGFQVLNPSTLSINFNESQATPLDPYKGAVFTQVINSKLYGPWSIDDIIYFREPSVTEDINAGLAPAEVALQTAQLGHNLERFVSKFFEGGAQPITVLNLPEQVDDNEFRRFQTEWQMRFQGVANAFRTAFVRSPDLKVSTITPPINQLMLPELQERVITSISMTFGVPRTMLEASAANYATADSDRQSFWRETIIPRLHMHKQVINSQLLRPLGYELYFSPEALDVMQTDETERSTSLLQLVQAGVPLLQALNILGYDQIEELSTILAQSQSSQPATPVASQPATPAPTVTKGGLHSLPQNPSHERGEDAMASKNADFALLSKKIERRIKSGKNPVCDFTSEALSPEHIAMVMARLTPTTTVAQSQEIIAMVKALGDMTPEEKRLYDKLVKVFQAKGEEWAKAIMRGAEVDPSLQKVLSPIFFVELQQVTQARLDEYGTSFGIPLPADESMKTIYAWMENYVPLLTARIDETTAERIKPIIELYRLTEGMDIKDLETLLLPLADPVRAQMIAITEVTRSAYQATDIYQGYLAERNIMTEQVWSTLNDEVVCDICGPLNNKPQSQWMEISGVDAPPAHVNCRCAVALVRRS